MKVLKTIENFLFSMVGVTFIAALLSISTAITVFSIKWICELLEVI